MTRPTVVEGGLWSLLAAGPGLVVALLLTFPGIDLGGTPQQPPPAPLAPPQPRPQPQPQPRPAPAAAGIVLAASGGDCWVEARAGSSTGEVLFLGLVEDGRTIRLRPGRVWVRLGASENVLLTVAGTRHPLPGGTVDLIV